MNFKEWLMALLGHTPHEPTDRVDLDAQQNRVADRLAKMRGSTRDEVLSEAYRRARVDKEARSYRARS